jgi:hypothetical protein
MLKQNVVNDALFKAKLHLSKPLNPQYYPEVTDK